MKKLILRNAPSETYMRRFSLVSGTEPHTLVLLYGDSQVNIQLNGPATVNELKTYLNGQFNWRQLDQRSVMIDGTKYSAKDAGSVMLAPDTNKVKFGQVEPMSIEILVEAPMKG